MDHMDYTDRTDHTDQADHMNELNHTDHTAEHWQDRTVQLIGAQAAGRISAASVAVFGLGGVGAAAAEALARAGVGRLTLVDRDVVSPSNLNRQLLALHSTLGLPKAEVMRARIADINPQAQVEAHVLFVTAESIGQVSLRGHDYIVDAVDNMTAKLLLVQCAQAAGVPIISCMGTGDKLDPTRFEVADISETSVCPLARIMRKELRARGVEHLKVLYSKEPPLRHGPQEGRHPPGSLSPVPPAAGMMLAAAVLRELMGKE